MASRVTLGACSQPQQSVPILQTMHKGIHKKLVLSRVLDKTHLNQIQMRLPLPHTIARKPQAQYVTYAKIFLICSSFHSDFVVYLPLVSSYSSELIFCLYRIVLCFIGHFDAELFLMIRDFHPKFCCFRATVLVCLIWETHVT